MKPDEAPRAIALACQSWLSVRHVSNRQAVEILLADLGLGEAEPIVLGQEIDAERVVMDDLDARRFPQRVGLESIGTLGPPEPGYRSAILCGLGVPCPGHTIRLSPTPESD